MNQSIIQLIPFEDIWFFLVLSLASYVADEFIDHSCAMVIAMAFYSHEHFDNMESGYIIVPVCDFSNSGSLTTGEFFLFGY